MSKVQTAISVSNVASWQDLRRYVDIALNRIVSEFNGNINFVDNIAASGPLFASFTASAVPVTITHSLGKVPTGFLLVSTDAPISVYAYNGPVVAFLQKSVTLAANGAGNIRFYVV